MKICRSCKNFKPSQEFYKCVGIREKQSYRCAICLTEQSSKKRLDIDHDHKSGEIGGLLCNQCNQLLGRALDNPKILEKASKYLQNPPIRGIFVSKLV